MQKSLAGVGAAQMAAAMTLSGTLGVFVLASGQNPWNVVFFRCLFGAIGLLAYCLARGLLRPGLFTRRNLILALLAGAALVMNWVLLFSAYRLASISLATAVYNVQPFVLMGLGAWFLGERPSRRQLAWAVAAFVGVLLVLRVIPGGADAGSLAGMALGLAAGCLYAVTALLVKRLQGVPPQVLALVQTALGVAMLLPLADFGALPQVPLQWGCLVLLGLVHTSLMYILLYAGLQKLTSAAAAPISFIYPAVALLLDALVYGQRLAPGQWAGVALIFMAVAGVSLRGAIPHWRPGHALRPRPDPLSWKPSGTPRHPRTPETRDCA